MGRRGRRGAAEEDFDLEAFEAEQAALAGGGSGSGEEEEGSGSSDIDSSDLDSDEAAAVEAAVAAALAAEGLDDLDSEEEDAAAAADQKDEDEEDDDAAPAPALTAAQKKRQRKKAAAQAKKAAAKASAAAAPPAAAAPAASEPAAGEAAGGDEPLEPPAHLNAAQKKKWRQKQRAKAKKAAAKAGAASGGAAAAGGAAAGGAAQPKKGAQPKQGGQRKGLSKGVAEALRAQREAQEAEEAAARKAAEEKAAAEAAAREAEEAEAERKRVAAAERRAKQKEKAAAKKAAAEKARVEAAKAARAAAGLPTGPAPKRVVYDSKKRKGKGRRGRFADDSDEEDKPAAASSAGASAGAAAAAAKTDEAPKVSAGKAEEEPEQKDTGAAAASAADAAADADAADGAGGDEEPSWASWADADVDALLGEGDKDGGDDDAAAAEAAAAEAAAAEQAAAAEAAAGKEDADDNAGDGTVQEGKMRSPICVILGHVDTGKTKLLDKIRRTNVQDNEAGGITQQIGATFFPLDAIQKQTARLPEKVQAKLQFKIPGLLIIDTPGHESFANLRNRGSSLCDIAILVVDIMHGMEPQTLESINLLKMRKTPFVVALNKVDRLYDWEPMPGAGIQESLKSQKPHTVVEFERRSQEALGLFAEQGLNAALWWKNPDARKWVSVVPTSAHSGEGIPDLLMLICQLTQKLQAARLYLQPTLQCVILEVKAIDGLGTTIDVILVNGELTSNDEIVVCGFDGPIVTKIRALLTPAPMRELRVKSAYTHHKVIPAAMGIKIAAPNLENAVAGSSLFVAGPDSDIDELQDRVMEDLNAVMSKVDKEDRGVFVQASTLGSLEALLAFLKEEKVPVAGVNIGTVNRKDVVKASVMLEHAREYAVILAFDVKISADARAEAEKVGVTMFEADIIYHLTDMFTKHLETVQEEKRRAAAGTAVFPCVLKVLPEYVINKTDPIIIGVEIVEGTLRLRTPLAVPSQHGIQIGRVASIEFDHKQLDKAEKGQQVAVRIDPDEGAQKYSYGRHFGENDQLVSVISRRSIDLLVAEFRDEITRADKHLLQKLKKVFGVV